MALSSLIATALLGPAAAQATTIVGEQSGPFQGWIDQAHVPTPRGEVVVVQEVDGPAHVTDANGNRWLGNGMRFIHWPYDAETTAAYSISRPLFLHEIGHVYDATTLRPKVRLRLIKSKLVGKYGWDGERFAMLYSYCALGAYPIEGWYGYGYAPSIAKHRRGCKLLRWGFG